MEPWVEIYITINLFIIGTLFGSFFSLATYRIPRKKDIVYTRSFCVNCNHNLGFFDLIPILSYAFNLGKCRYCKKKISIRYPIYESMSGIFFSLVFLIFKFSYITIIIYIVYITLVLYIGCKISYKKMDKKGFLFIEILIAIVFFSVAITTTYINSKNYIDTYTEEQIEAEAYNLALINTELSLGTKYDSLVNSSSTTTLNGIVYEVDIDVSNYNSDFIDKEDVIKEIKVSVNYVYNETQKNVEINSIKKRI